MIVGLTGSIATGKSTVSAMFQEAGIPVVDADIAARRVVDPGMPTLGKIVETFGQKMLLSDGSLDRQALGDVIFNDEEARKTLNSIMHPAIRAWMEKEKQRYVEEGAAVIIMDIPLLIENDLVHTVDEVIVVSVSESTQKERLMKRNNLSEEEALARIQSQIPVKEKEVYATYVISNEGTLQETKQQVEEILDKWSTSTK